MSIQSITELNRAPLQNPSKPTAIGYIRRSIEDKHNKSVSIELQQSKIQDYCKLHDLYLKKIIVDSGKSGKDLNRAGIQKVIALAKTGEINAVIVYRLDRLSRRVKDILTLVEDIFSSNHIKLHSITELIDTGSPQGRFLLNILSSLAQMERETISERMKDAFAELKRQGKRIGSTPLGYLNGGGRLRINNAEMKVVTYIKTLRAQEFSLSSIAQKLNVEGYPTKRGGKWYAGTVKYILERT